MLIKFRLDFIFVTHVPYELNLNETLQLLRNCACVKLIFLKATKKVMMEDREMTFIAMGDKVIACNYFQLCQGNLHIKKYGTQASKTNWIASDITPTFTIDILPASRWNTCQEIEQGTVFVSWNVVLFFVEYF